MKNFLLMAALGLMAVTNGVAQSNESAILNKNGTMEYQLATRADATEYWADMAASSYAGGSGTEADPYLIETPEQLAKLVADAMGTETNTENWKNLLEGVYFKQTADIDLSAHPCNGMGIGQNGRFAGIYDGNGYVIKGYNMNYESDKALENVGVFSCLFGNIQNAIIKNVHIEDYKVNIDLSNRKNSYSTNSLLAAYVYNSQIENCTVSGEMNATIAGQGFSANYGGIVGYANNTTINNCSTEGTITVNLQNQTGDLMSYMSCGGIVCEAENNTKLINCINRINIEGTATGLSEAGLGARSSGIVTWANNVQIVNCGNQGNLSAKETRVTSYNWVQVAGIGSCVLNSTVNNCWNAGNLYSEGHVEAEAPLSILCYWENVTKNNCYYNREAENAVGSGTDKGLAASYMQSEAFVSDLNENLPEGGKEWSYREGDYPTLQAEESTPDANEQIHVSNTTFRLTPEGVEINAEQASDIAIYTMQGIQKTARQIPAGTTSIALAPGIYILQLNGEGHKIVIR